MTEPEVPHFYPDRRQGAPVVLTGADLTIADVEAVARGGVSASLDIHARERMQEARDLIESLVAEGAVVYGVTTGFGALASTTIAPEEAGRLQRNLLMSHAAGVGAPFPREVVRAMLLLRANTLALGHSGCRPLLVDRLLEFLRLGLHPVVPEQGSVGASGDLGAAGPSRAASDRPWRGGAGGRGRAGRGRVAGGGLGAARAWRPRRASRSSTGRR